MIHTVVMNCSDFDESRFRCHLSCQMTLLPGLLMLGCLQLAICVVTGPRNWQVLFCWLSSVVVCNAAGGRRGHSGGRHCTAGQSYYVPVRTLFCPVLTCYDFTIFLRSHCFCVFSIIFLYFQKLFFRGSK